MLNNIYSEMWMTFRIDSDFMSQVVKIANLLFQRGRGSPHVTPHDIWGGSWFFNPRSQVTYKLIIDLFCLQSNIFRMRPNKNYCIYVLLLGIRGQWGVLQVFAMLQMAVHVLKILNFQLWLSRWPRSVDSPPFCGATFHAPSKKTLVLLCIAGQANYAEAAEASIPSILSGGGGISTSTLFNPQVLLICMFALFSW